MLDSYTITLIVLGVGLVFVLLAIVATSYEVATGRDLTKELANSIF